MVPKFCRIALLVNDMASFIDEMGRLLGTSFFRPRMIEEQYGGTGLDVTFGEHGIEPISVTPTAAIGFTQAGRLIEVAIDVADAEATKKRFAAAGYQPAVNSYLPFPDKYEYLFGRDFHGIPLMVCTAGDNEAQVRSERPFAALDDAPVPKIGCVTLVVDDLDRTVAELGQLLDMKFSASNPDGFGRRAAVGDHRVKLVEGPSELVASLERPLLSIDIMHDDVEAARRRFEEAGYPVKLARPLASGGTAYYFGETVQGMPVSLYPVAADAEILGRVSAGSAHHGEE
jgi:hypothetical protein